MELLEISVVAVPGNSRAVRVKEAPVPDPEVAILEAQLAALEAQVAALAPRLTRR